MLYGVGWIASTDTSITRFAVMSVALAITVGLGWLRFARRPARAADPAEAGELARIEGRVEALEERLREAGRLLERGRGR
jgi:hypothetical protein